MSGLDPRASWIEIPRPDIALPAVLALPNRAPPGAPGILILHEILGLTAHIESLPARFAAEGYAALAPNLLARQTPPPDGSPLESIRAFAIRQPNDHALADIAAALATLAATPGVDASRLALLGFSYGGTLTLLAHGTPSVPPVRAAVAFYPKVVYPAVLPTRPVSALDVVPAFRAPTLAHFGGLDRAIPASEIGLLQDALETQKARGLEHAVHVYPGARHGFFNDLRKRTYDESAAALAWDRTLAFLERHVSRRLA